MSLRFIHSTDIHKTTGIRWEEGCRARIAVILSREVREGLAIKWHLSKDLKEGRVEPSRYLEKEPRKQKEQSL